MTDEFLTNVGYLIVVRDLTYTSRQRDVICSVRLLSPFIPTFRMEVQVFGVQKSQDVRKTLRFWSERRVKVHFVDLRNRAASKGELERFARKFGVGALIDKEARRYLELGLGLARYGNDRWLEKLAEEPLILRIPLTRWQANVTIGLAEDEWNAWIQQAAG